MGRGGRSKGQKVKEYGQRAALIDRRREVWGLRVKGLSFRAIGEELGIDPGVAWKDCRKAEEEWGSVTDDPEIVRQQLLVAHSQLIGSLMKDLEKQAQQGQITESYDADGKKVGSTAKRWISPQSAAEVGRCLTRVAQLMGLQDGAGVDGGGGGTQQTFIQLSMPAGGNEFEQRYGAGAAATDAQVVDATASPAAQPNSRTASSPDASRPQAGAAPLPHGEQAPVPAAAPQDQSGGTAG